jgi:hypothetical protein
MAMTDLARLGFGSLLSAWLGYGIITMTMGSAWFSYLLGSLVADDYLGFAWPLVLCLAFGTSWLLWRGSIESGCSASVSWVGMAMTDLARLGFGSLLSAWLGTSWVRWLPMTTKALLGLWYQLVVMARID